MTDYFMGEDELSMVSLELGIVTDQDLLNVERWCSEGQSRAGGSFWTVL